MRTRRLRRSSFSSSVLLLLLLLLLLSLCSVVSHAAWTITTMEPVVGATISEQSLNILSSSKIRVRFLCDSAQFTDGVTTDRSIFLGGCSSNVPQNPYGFDYWRQNFSFLATIVQDANGLSNGIDLTVFARRGFTLTQSETVTCVIGSTYVFVGTLDVTTVSFSIAAATSIYVQLLSYEQKPLWWSVQRNSFATVYSESFIRDSGLTVMMNLIGDAWNKNTPLSRASNFSCTCNGDDNACTFFAQTMSNLRYLSFDGVSNPQSIVLSVPRTLVRLFNTKSDVQLCLIVPPGVQFGYKVLPLGAAKIDTCFTVKANAFAVPNLFIARLLRNETVPASGMKGLLSTTMVLTEDCIRGRNTTVLCGAAWWLFLSDIGGSQIFTDTPLGKTDFIEVGVLSKALDRFLSVIAGSRSISETSLNGNGLVALNMVLTIVGDLSYQVNDVDTLFVTVPYSAMAQKESPKNSILIYVVPSPGDIIGAFPSEMSLSSLWSGGGVTGRIHLGGEEWIPDVVTNMSLTLNAMTGNRSSDGWKTWASCVLPPGSLSFENVSGVVNQSVLIFSFQPCPQYTVGGDEIVSMSFDASFGVSRLGFASATSLSFLIRRSPPTFVVTGNVSYTEDTITTAVFFIQLQGGSTFIAPIGSSCLASIRATWVTNQPTDPSAWGNTTVRDSLLNAQSLTLVPDRYGTMTGLRITFLRSAAVEYGTTSGETISIGSLDANCVISDGSVPPSSPTNISIRPRPPSVSVVLSTSSDGPSSTQQVIAPVNATFNVTSKQIRDSSISFLFTIANDTFATSIATVTASFATSSPQPFGFRALKSRLLSPSWIFINDSQINVTLVPHVMQFAITGTEQVTIHVSSAWVASNQDVANYTLNIIPAPGAILLVGWLGQDTNVTEEDVRSGSLWFTFAMLGDQWRQERDPYVAMFTGPRGEATGMLSLIDQLVPSIEFFNFTSTDTYQYMTMTLQASDAYDLSSPETIHISFSSGAASSGLAPQFQSGDGTFSFVVVPTPGRLVLSGQTYLTEKIVREGGARLLLTLFGETWGYTALLRNTTSNTTTNSSSSSNISLITECVRSGVHIATDAGRDALFRQSVLPSASVQLFSSFAVIEFLFVSERRFALPAGSVDILTIAPNRSCFRSGLVPYPGVVNVTILKTRGELAVSSNPVEISEADIRSSDVSLFISISGNQWNTAVMQYDLPTATIGNASTTQRPATVVSVMDSTASALLSNGWRFSSICGVGGNGSLINVKGVYSMFLSGFSSSMSPIEQPFGFAQKIPLMLQSALLNNDVVNFCVNSTTMNLKFGRTQTFDISQSEAITFAISDASLMSDGLLPDPARIQFLVKALPQALSMLYQPPGGQFDSLQLAAGLSNLLSLSSPSVVVVTPRAQRGLMFTVEVVFNTSATSTEVDARTETEMAAALLAFQSTFLEDSLGILCVALNGSNCSAAGPPPPADSNRFVLNGASFSTLLVIAGVVTVSVSLITYLSLVYRQTGLTGSLRPKFVERQPIPYVDGGGPAEEERQPLAEQTQAPMTLREFVRRRNESTADDTYFTDKDLEATEDEPSPSNTLSYEKSSLEHVVQEHMRQQRLEQLQQKRRGASALNVQRALDMRADFQL